MCGSRLSTISYRKCSSNIFHTPFSSNYFQPIQDWRFTQFVHVFDSHWIFCICQCMLIMTTVKLEKDILKWGKEEGHKNERIWCLHQLFHFRLCSLKGSIFCVFKECWCDDLLNIHCNDASLNMNAVMNNICTQRHETSLVSVYFVLTLTLSTDREKKHQCDVTLVKRSVSIQNVSCAPFQQGVFLLKNTKKCEILYEHTYFIHQWSAKDYKQCHLMACCNVPSEFDIFFLLMCFNFCLSFHDVIYVL